MVDFNSDSTIGTPLWHTCQVLILEGREEFIQAYKLYLRARGKGVNAPTYEMKASLNALFEQLRDSLQDTFKDGGFEELQVQLGSDKFEDLYSAWNTMSGHLYKKQVTKWDNKKQYDSTRTETENYEVGLG
jgi:hypothetical protein